MRKDLTLACKDEGTEIYRVLLTLSVKSTSRSRGKKEKRNGEKRTIMPTYFHLFFLQAMSQSQTHPIFLVINLYTLQVQSVQTYLGVRKMSTPGIGRQNKTHSTGFNAPQCRSAEQLLACGFFGARNICKTKGPQQSFTATQPNKL